MTMKIKLDDGAIMPTRAHPTDAGLDLYSMEDKKVPAHGSAVFDTGVHIELPKIRLDMGFIPEDFMTVGLIKSKSGLNVHHNIVSEGVIDVGYTGSIRVKLYNHGNVSYAVNRGDKISQLVILPILTPTLKLVDSLSESERGDGGFGSTGK